METFVQYIRDMVTNKSVRKKLLFTLIILVLYRFLVFIPVPFVDVGALLSRTLQSGGGLEYFAMLL